MFDRRNIEQKPLAQRHSKLGITDIAILPEAARTAPIAPELARRLRPIARDILEARKNNAPVVCAFGAHAIKNGLGPLLKGFLERGYLSHLATNGAGIIHDWEFAYQGRSSEDVRENVSRGEFGTWAETGLYINLALALGAYEGLGYGESVGRMISRQGLELPDSRQLEKDQRAHPALWKRAAAADLLDTLQEVSLPAGWLPIPHPEAGYSVQAAAYELGLPFTGHPMFGHDIIYTHPVSNGAAIGRAAQRDFLRFADSVQKLSGGVYLSVGSGVMSPMIFEKSLSMARNVLLQQGRRLDDCRLVVVDLQPETWDWSRGEPGQDNPAYYQRFMKTFNRMGCPLSYLCADNRLFFQGLFRLLEEDREG